MQNMAYFLVVRILILPSVADRESRYLDDLIVRIISIVAQIVSFVNKYWYYNH